MNANISEELRRQVIEEYEAQKRVALLEKRCKSRPLGRAQRYFGLLTDVFLYRSKDDSAVTREWKAIVNEFVKEAIRRRYDLVLITDLKPEYYDEANEYAIELFTNKTKESKYFNNTIDIFGLPWIRNDSGFASCGAERNMWYLWRRLLKSERLWQPVECGT